MSSIHLGLFQFSNHNSLCEVGFFLMMVVFWGFCCFVCFSKISLWKQMFFRVDFCVKHYYIFTQCMIWIYIFGFFVLYTLFTFLTQEKNLISVCIHTFFFSSSLYIYNLDQMFIYWKQHSKKSTMISQEMT